ncbi:hypothetical protein PUN28_008024 [Cardiocondyla obscurior]|uniref:Uncharacterized protein n=1 Tax=Cardiocondyla obscurior TaxID=286306 RepID=A0AAW2G0M8_9HYME
MDCGFSFQREDYREFSPMAGITEALEPIQISAIDQRQNTSGISTRKAPGSKYREYQTKLTLSLSLNFSQMYCRMFVILPKFPPYFCSWYIKFQTFIVVF